MGDNGFGGNGRVHVMCLTIHMNNNYSKPVLYITEFYWFSLSFFVRIQYEHLAHYLF